MGNTIPHGDRLHECSPTCPEAPRVDSDDRLDDLGPALRKRDGDQDLPVPNDHLSCQERFMERIGSEMPARMALGRHRYGTLLQPLNGRNFMRDAFDELLDLSVYLEGVAFEREAMMDLLYDVAVEEPNESLQRRARVLLLSMGQALDLSE